MQLCVGSFTIVLAVNTISTSNSLIQYRYELAYFIQVILCSHLNFDQCSYVLVNTIIWNISVFIPSQLI